MRKSFGIVLVAAAATLWGLDQWIRGPLSATTTAATIVFGEHLVLVVLTLPLAAGALAAVFRLGWRHILAAVAVGAGASAVATILFTEALFTHNDFVTPVVLQKVQPVFAVLGAMVVLDERPGRRYAPYFAAALVPSGGARPRDDGVRTRRRAAVGARHGVRPLPRARPALRARDDAPVPV